MLYWSLYSFRFFFFQAEDGIRDLVRSRGLGDVYKRQQMFTDQQILLAAKRLTDEGWGSGAVA